MEKLEGVIKELIEEDGKTSDEVFEVVNCILIKSRKKEIRKVSKGRKRRPVCRPVLLISESSDDE